MTISLSPCLWYSKSAVEAAHFYTSIIPGSRIDRISALQADSPSGPAGSVAIVEFTVAGTPVYAFAAESPYAFNEAISFMLHCDTQEEIDRLWAALLEGGGQEVACGLLIDRYGLRWQIVPRKLSDMIANPDRAKAAAAAKAMLSMKKYDIAALMKAYEEAV